MHVLFSLLVTMLMSATSLGVGSSTLAISSFLVALKDKNIEPAERKLLGVIYFALRVAMAGLALSSFLLYLFFPGTITSLPFIWALLFLLTANSICMTKKWISFRIGPALQAATWYTLGFVLTIESFQLLELELFTFLLLFGADIIVSLLVTNFFIHLYTATPRQK